MLRTFLCAGLAACALPCHAETWHFEYTGFHDSVADIFMADRKLTGSFVGFDSDGDGAVALAEISSLMLNGHDYVACAGESNAYWRCGTDAFSYTPGGALTFTAAQWGRDPEGWVGRGHHYVAGEREFGYYYSPVASEDWEYRWTAQTSFVISSAPEPGTWALLLAGLPLAVIVARRKKK